MQQFEIKRKIFDVIEQLGDRSYKVSRNGNLYFLKDYGKDKAGFENFIERTHSFKVSGIVAPKVYAYDKNNHVVAIDFIDGDFVLDMMQKENLPEPIYDCLFKQFWYAKSDKMALDFKPENFKYWNGKLYYLPFVFSKFESNDAFLKKDLRLWFYTKDFARYLQEKGIDPDLSRLKDEYSINKEMALMSVKYFR